MPLTFDESPDGTLLTKLFIVDGVTYAQLGFKTPVDKIDANGNPDPSDPDYIFVPNVNQPECPEDAEILGYTPNE